MNRASLILISIPLLLAAGCAGSNDPANSEPARRPSTSPASTQPATATRRIHAFIAGHVQGVGFRAYTQEQAEHLKLTGWVRNLPDGRVEAIIEGPTSATRDMIDRLHLGPTGSRVDEVKINDETPDGSFTGFKVTH